MFQHRRNSQDNSLHDKSRRSFWQCIRGVAAVEFAITVSLLFIPFLGGVEVGYAAFQAMQVQSAVEAGALYAAKNGFDSANIGLAVRNASTVTGVTAAPSPSRFYGCPSNSGITAVASTSICASGAAPGAYVQINATLTRQSLIPSSGLVLPAVLSAKSVIRLD